MAAFELLSNTVRLSPERRIEDSVGNFHSLTACRNTLFCNMLRRDARERRSDGDVESAMNGFFNRLLDCRLLSNLMTLAEVLNDGGGISLLCGR